MKNKFLFVVLAVVLLSGCARLQEVGKVFWGSSTKALEEARPSAISKTYRCFFPECFDAVVSIVAENEYEIFIQSSEKELIVVMNTPHKIKVLEGEEKPGPSTTEIGIFIEPLQLKEMRVEVVSLSASAKESVSEKLFSALDKLYPIVEFDTE
ncbi:MAG: hypothetical protein P9M07_06010 [Candidatus Aceula meridiana]|nr:hypothetical protein [Candidatus Aceula meridiana]